MNRRTRVMVNAAFAIVFLVGVALVWTGLGDLMLAGRVPSHGLSTLAAGFSILVALALADGVARPTRTGAPR